MKEMEITESLNTQIVPSWHDRSESGFSIIDAEFMFGDDLVTVRFKRFRPDPEWDMYFNRGGTLKMTGQGGQFKIMSAVMLIMKEFIRIRRPIGFMFSADSLESSRVSLYGKLARMVKNVFPEYEMTEKVTFRSHMFRFRKDGGPDPVEKEYMGEPVTGEPEKPSRPRYNREELDRILAQLTDLTESNPWKEIPVMYHGTSSRNLNDIMKRGLVPQSNPDSALRGNWSTIPNYTDKNVYLTTDYDLAKGYADAQVRHDAENSIESSPMVLEVRIPDPSKIIPDDDYLNIRGSYHAWTQLPIEKKKRRYGAQYIDPPEFGGSTTDVSREIAAHDPFTQSIKYNKSVAYRGRIPASFLRIID